MEVYYKDNTQKDRMIEEAKTYILGQVDAEKTEEPTETPEINPLATDAKVEYPQEESSGGIGGWLIGGALLLAAGGGGYYWYTMTQRKRQAAQRLAQKKAQQQRNQQAANRPQGQQNTNRPPQQAQSAARVRTGTYTDQNGTVAPKPGTGSGSGTDSSRQYGKTMENPYSRYTSGTEEDHTYTASFKPEENGSSAPRRRTRVERNQNLNGSNTSGEPKA